MRFRNAVSITADNFSSVFKLLLHRLVVSLVFLSMSYVIVRYGLAVVLESAELASCVSLLKSFPSALFSGDVASLQTFQTEFHEAIKALGALIASNSGALVGAIIGVVLMYLAQRFCNGLAIFALANTVNDRMSTFTRTSFSASYFRSIGRAARFQLVYVPVTFLYDALSVAACYFLFFFLPSAISLTGFAAIFAAISLTVTTVVLLQALKMTCLSSWLPAVAVDKKPIFAAFASCFKGNKRTVGRFIGFMVGIYLIIAVNVLFGFVSFGGALLITVPLSYLFLLSLQFVNYFEAQNRKYFISKDRIVGSNELTTTENQSDEQ